MSLHRKEPGISDRYRSSTPDRWPSVIRDQTEPFSRDDARGRQKWEGCLMELVENRESVGMITSALAAGRSLAAVAAEFGLSIQALRELLVRNAYGEGRAAG